MMRLGWMGAIAATLAFGVALVPAETKAILPPLEAPTAGAPGPGQAPIPGRPGSTSVPRDIRREGPPGDVREDNVGPAPGPDYFYIPGQYVPAGDSVTWRPGFWARSQAGWEWMPARWVRLSEGWTYREGHWVRAGGDRGAPESPRRHVVARPSAGAFSPREAGTAPNDPGSATNPSPELAPLPEADPLAVPGNSNPSQPTVPDSTPVPDPRPVDPGVPLVTPLPPPITELNLPGVYVRVAPGPLPWVGPIRGPYPPVLVPQVQVRVRPLQGVREMVRGLLGGPYP